MKRDKTGSGEEGVRTGREAQFASSCVSCSLYYLSFVLPHFRHGHALLNTAPLSSPNSLTLLFLSVPHPTSDAAATTTTTITTAAGGLEYSSDK
ncbi:hypothetical protein O3P69_014229 [Scylla paramamosain]|uniref:Uncharacterized protein n=1 Tax=Scylla paramamosain TaxID=85552 RepID=A0AAW0SJ83_SCYPA